MLDYANGLVTSRRFLSFAQLLWLAALLMASVSAVHAAPGTVSVRVVTPNSGGPLISTGFRWLLEEDVTYPVTPCLPTASTSCPPPSTTDTNTLALNLHKSYMPVVATGSVATGGTTTISVPDTSKRYFLSVLPNEGGDCQLPGHCFTMSGHQIAVGQSSVTVAVTSQPIPTAQIFVRAHEDSAPINNVWDDGEAGLGGFNVFIYDMAGQLNTDTYGNPIGTVYEGLASDGTPRVKRLGDGSIHTMTAAEVNDPNKNPYGLEVGEALVKNIAPGKYGVQVVPPYGQDWHQTSTIEGTKGLDTWVKAGEPRYFAEFGPAGHHAEFGFVRPANFPRLTGSHTITGRVTNLRMQRPPEYSFSSGHPLPGCWVGLNDGTATQGLYATRCNDDSTFAIPNVPPGDYQLVIWDDYLDTIWDSKAVTVPPSGNVDLGDVTVFRWWQSHEHWVFNDLNENGQRDPGEDGIPDQVINLRYRDGSIYSSSTTDTTGYLPFDEVFPFFSWLIAEVDFARFKATGVTVAIDAGGPIQGPEENGSVWPRQSVGHGHLNPQQQSPDEASVVYNAGVATGARNPDTRTECTNKALHAECSESTAPILLEGYNAFLGTTNTFEWGKKSYAPGENGGITGVIQYSTTRAENDPRFAAAETWEPGVPRVQVNLYRGDEQGNILHADGSASSPASPPVLADVDNYPFGWEDGTAPKGTEDIDRNGNGAFDLGDAIEVAHSDSFDDSPPTGCPGQHATSTDPNPTGDPFYHDGKCYDGLRNYNQVRPTVFDGGFAFGKPFTDLQLDPGYYVVEANAPPGYLHQREEDKNVDFGDKLTLSPQALPWQCVGDQHQVPDELALFPGVPSLYAGQSRALCDRKLVLVSDGKNTATNFFLFTEVPVTGHINGFVLNDLANEFDVNSPNFGEKFAPSYIPVSVRDYAGNEVYHTYTDNWGTYNAIVPTAYRINTPMPSGVSPNMLQVCLNSPMMEDPANPGKYKPDPFFNKQYTQFCYTLDFKPGQTTYLDTPVLPIAAFSSPGNFELDCEYPTGTPVIHTVSAEGNTLGGGPFVRSTGSVAERTLTITSAGTVNVRNPQLTRVDGSNANLVQRDFGFGSPSLTVAQLNASTSPWRVTLGGVRLQIVSWSNGVISVLVPATASTGQLEVVRGDTSLKTVHGLTVIVGGASTTPRVVQPGHSIQEIIDQTPAGGIVLVPPGNYNELLVVTKPIQLQSWGADATVLNAAQSPSDKISEWRKKVNYLANCSHQLGLLPGQPNNTAAAGQPCGFTPGSGLLATEEGAGILVAPVSGAFNGTPARIDGFTVTGADQSAGIVVNGYAKFLEISNNVIANNQGPFAAGIRVGQPALIGPDDAIVDGDNDDINIHNNHITENGGLIEPGAGIGIYTGSERYRVTSNYVCGNFATGDGGGIAHYGLSNGGLIADNKVLFNQTFDQTVGTGGNGGGILVSGANPINGAAVGQSPGAGRVKVLRNLIQGNNAGSGDGGGIALRFVNGQDVLASTNQNNWFSVDILNNVIVNNVTGLAGGGISMQDALRVAIVNDTIVNNDSTATAANAFAGGQVSGNLSSPQPAGIVSRAHSTSFAGTPGAGTYSNPRAVLNNIVLGNRSKHWVVSPTCGPGPGGATIGCLVNDYYSNFAVLGVPGASFTSSVQSNLLTTTTTPTNTLCGANGNRCLALSAVPGVGDEATEQTVLNDTYFNVRPGLPGIFQPDGTITAGAENPVLAAAATDEGGNFLDVHYGPLTPTGNYHILSTANLALNGGTAPSASQFPNRSPDIDGQARPSGATLATVAFDIGADEVAQAVTNTSGGNLAPTITNLPSVTAGFVGTPYIFQVVATDPNADALTYTMSRVGGGGLNGLQINSSTGAVTGTPTNTAALAVYLISVSDGTASASSFLTVTVLAPGSIAAVADAYSVNTNGTFTVPARGVLANDLPALTRGTFTATLLTNVASGGSVGLESNGAVTFTPDSTWVGSTSFTYEARNISGQTSTGTVTLSREIAVTDAGYTASSGTWKFRGMSSVAGRTLTFVRTRGNVTLGTTTTDGTGEWTAQFTGQGWQAGDTVNVTASGASQPNFVLQLVAVSGLSASTAPLSTSYVQCPGDTDGDAVIDHPDPAHPRAVCKHLAAGDGFARMADGTELYTFGFNDVTGVPANLAIDKGILNAHFPAPTLAFNEGDEVYLTLTNVGMLKRPDLFDPHSVHFHGFPNAATVFDGVPESSIAINMGFSFTYYYSIREPGTFMYHCHVEAAEHMQMGMLGNLYVHPAQDGQSIGGHTKFVYNDQDGSTGYDVEVPIQIGSFDSNFHIQHIGVQPLPFAEMHDDYPMLNGRGYPDTVNTGAIPPVTDGEKATAGVTSSDESSQVVHTRVEATAGQKVLLRISNLNVTRFYTLATTGLPMKVVGTGAHILRGPGGANLYYDTSSVTLGGGEAVDVLVDTAGAAPGTYLLYSTNLEALSNGNEDFGGMMTEIVIH
jgi:hypothetical protein